MIRLLIHSFREMRTRLTGGFILFLMGWFFRLMSEPGYHPSAIFFLAPAVMTSPWLLYSSRYNVDFTLPVHRKTLYHCKMTAISLAVGIGFGVPLLAFSISQTGGLSLDMVRTTVPLLAYLFASVSVSVAIWPALKKLGNDGVAYIVMLIVAAIVVIVHGSVAVLIYDTVTLNDPVGYLLVAGLMIVCFLAYWAGRGVFVRYEPVAQAGATATNVSESMAARSGSPAPDWDLTSGGEHSGPGKAAGPLIKAGEGTTRAAGAQGTIGTQAAGSPHFHRTPPAQSGAGARQCGAGSSRGPCEPLSISTAWRFLWLTSPLRTRVIRAFIVLLLPAVQLIVVASLTQPALKASALLIVTMWLPISLVNARVDGDMLVRLVPAAFPRRRLFSMMTLTRLSPVLVGTLLPVFFMNLSATVLVGAVTLAFHSLIFWLGVAPSPRQVRATRIHYLLKLVCTVGLFLILGVWALVAIVQYPLAVRLPAQGSSYFSIEVLLQPSVAWQVSGACVLVAILLWVQAYKRFKYMEGVPHR